MTTLAGRERQHRRFIGVILAIVVLVRGNACAMPLVVATLDGSQSPVFGVYLPPRRN